MAVFLSKNLKKIRCVREIKRYPWNASSGWPGNTVGSQPEWPEMLALIARHGPFWRNIVEQMRRDVE